MTHDTDEGKQHDRFAEQLEALAKAGSLTLVLLFFDRCTSQEEGSCDSDNHIDWEEDSPAQAEGWNACHGTPHSDVWCKKGSYRLYELSEGQSRSQVLT